jgi:hypothetical protein
LVAQICAFAGIVWLFVLPSLLSRPVKQQDDANANPTPDEVTSLAKAVTRTTEKNKDRLA